VTVVVNVLHQIIGDSSVGIAMVCGLAGRDSIPGSGKRFISFPQCLHELSISPSFLPNGYRGVFFAGGKEAGT
jgi:hypothetical protein